GGRTTFLDYARREQRPDAVFCGNDQLAMGIMDAARFELGWMIPEDMSVVGFDDVSEAARPGYRLTTVHQDSVEMGRQAVRLLLARLEEPGRRPVRSEVPSVFIRRGSARLPDSAPNDPA
ncbi:MAG: substrate-binding domain-containing protein, partial [Acetobacteraceae bacterium]